MKKTNIRAMCRMALCAALLCISAYVMIPVPLSAKPITAQTIFVNLVALLLTPSQAAVTVGLYIFLGALGLPVFAGGIGGPGALVGPYSGYIYGFFIAAVLISLAKGKKPNVLRYSVVTICIGVPIIDLGAVVSLMLVNGLDLPAAFLAGALPFLAGDVAKCIAASLIAAGMEKAIRKID